MKYLLFLGLFLVTGCTDSRLANFASYGNAGHIICYSGGKVILDTISTGKITTVRNSDGWEFKDSRSGKFMRVSGPCVIEN